jgi:6-phosphogluconolactonase/glucosamine-6-phosphate isomerase/deaminase
METKTVILQVSGQTKSTIVKHLLETEPSIDFPASLLKLHPNAFLLLDREAAKV